MELMFVLMLDSSGTVLDVPKLPGAFHLRVLFLIRAGQSVAGRVLNLKDCNPLLNVLHLLCDSKDAAPETDNPHAPPKAVNEKAFINSRGHGAGSRTARLTASAINCT
jgi:hypothetical protein